MIDGHDPAAYAWAILEAEARLERFIQSGRPYPAPLPYIIAKCVKGFGFPGAGTNRAHNLPLSGNPHSDETARREFHDGARALFVPPDQLDEAVRTLATHVAQRRPRESANAIAARQVGLPHLTPPTWVDPGASAPCPMQALDEEFLAIVQANPQLRPRVANPDELKSNHMGLTLAALRHRVNSPEAGVPEAVDGAVITALNEEAVIGAALGNKGGLNLAVSYEAFAMKMLGALRQDIIFARRQREIGRQPGWLSVPLIATSHTWENAKNEQSHQDPTLAEALLGEMSDTARVLFPIDANSAIAALRAVYRSHGQIACLVTPKRNVPGILSGVQAEAAVAQGAILIAGDPQTARLQFVAVGAYQTLEALHAYDRAKARGIATCVTVIVEPGRLRSPRDEIEQRHVAEDEWLASQFPVGLPRIILTHTRPEPMLGVLRRIDGGPASTRSLGYINRGGTLDVFGMLFANGCTWAHAIKAGCDILGMPHSVVLSSQELLATEGRGDPYALLTKTRTGDEQ